MTNFNYEKNDLILEQLVKLVLAFSRKLIELKQFLLVNNSKTMRFSLEKNSVSNRKQKEKVFNYLI